MRLKNQTAKNLYKYIISYFVLWILLFEFILPVNNILPRPSVVLMSFSALWNYYRLPINFMATVSAVYLSILLAYLLTSLLSGVCCKKKSFCIRVPVVASLVFCLCTGNSIRVIPYLLVA